MKEKILEKLNELKKDYDMWLEVLDNKKLANYDVAEARLHDLRLQIMILEELLEEK